MALHSGVELRWASLEDLEEIGRLLAALAGPLFPERFPGQTAADFCRWKYFSNPIGDAVVGIAVDGPHVVSLVAAVPKRILVGSQTVLAFESGDAITAADYRKRGLFSALTTMVCDRAAERGATFVYGRPNPMAYRIRAKRHAYQEIQRADERRFPLPSHLIQRRTGLPAGWLRGLGLDWAARQLVLPAAAESVAVEPVTRFGEDMDEFWARVQPFYSFALVRDARYLNWRYVDCPSPYCSWIARRNGRPAGYVTGLVYRANPIAYIVDLFTHPADADAAAALLRAAMQSLLAAGPQVCTGHIVYRMYRAHGEHFLGA